MKRLKHFLFVVEEPRCSGVRIFRALWVFCFCFFWKTFSLNKKFYSRSFPNKSTNSRIRSQDWTGIALFYFDKVSFMKHPTVQVYPSPSWFFLVCLTSWPNTSWFRLVGCRSECDIWYLPAGWKRRERRTIGLGSSGSPAFLDALASLELVM